MIISNLKRFLQESSQCAIAACACIGNYYNKKINYDNTKKVALTVCEGVSHRSGLDAGEMGILLNKLGFRDVTIISTDMGYLDYSWEKLNKNELIDKLVSVARKSSHPYRYISKKISDFLIHPHYNNHLVIDYHFGDIIRKHISLNCPVIISFNWSLFFKLPKYDGNHVDPIFGDPEFHAVVVYGYDSHGVFILDSHQEDYKYRLKKFRSGRYKMLWEDLMIGMANGEITIPTQYNKGYACELV